MSVKRIFLFLFCLPIFQLAFGQSHQFIAKDSIIGKYDLFSVDNLGRTNLCRNDIIIQLDKTKDTLYAASLKTMRPSQMESVKTFRTLVFDKDRGVISFLDNTLTDINGEIDLMQLDILQPILACESYLGNSFWVLDAAQRNLLKLNSKLVIQTRTENLYQVFDYENPPTQMLEYNDFLYILIPDEGVAIFDVFGTFIKLYKTKATSIGVYDRYLLLQTGNKIEAIANKTFKSTDLIYTIPKGVKQFYFTHDKIYLLKQKSLLIGQFIQ